MSKLSITVETEDPVAVKAVYSMLRGLISDGASIPNPADTLAPPADDKPALKVVPPPAAGDGVEHTYNVDGRDYAADDIRSAGFTVEQLKRAGLLVEEIVDVLGVTAELVDATPVTDPGEEAQAAPETDATGINTNNAPLDSVGMPWDPRIHAGTKTKISDGSWKMKRGVDKAIVELVEAELIDLMEIEPAETKAPVVIPPPPANTEEATVIPPPAAGEGDDMPADAMAFAEFLKACSAKMTAGETNMARILEVVNAKGIASLQLVNSRQDLIPELWALIEQHQKAAQ